jgi:hypothetical protein
MGMKMIKKCNELALGGKILLRSLEHKPRSQPGEVSGSFSRQGHESGQAILSINNENDITAGYQE